MKLFIGSDIHGSEANLLRFLNIVDTAAKSDPDVNIASLGDIYNHGPRNPFPEGYAPMKVAALLNARKDCIMAIKGNCDSEVDQMISEFEIGTDCTCEWLGYTLHFTHGHKCNPELPLKDAKDSDIVFYGHFHKPTLTVSDGVLYICVGALGLSAQGVPRSYAVLDEHKLAVKNLDNGNTIIEVSLQQ